jgi:hypothetical protein
MKTQVLWFKRPRLNRKPRKAGLSILENSDVIRGNEFGDLL